MKHEFKERPVFKKKKSIYKKKKKVFSASKCFNVKHYHSMYSFLN